MTKRKLVEEEVERRYGRAAKRQRQGGRIHIFQLSDELLLRSLSFLPIESLVRCEQVCEKLCRLSRDNEIWREKYYNQFVRRRARRLPVLQATNPEEIAKSALHYSSKRARWLEHTHLLHVGAGTDWKHVYKVKHNWNRGRARKSEVQIDSKPKPVALARACRGRLYTADLDHGLRVWRKGDILQTCRLTQNSAPSALSVESDGTTVRVCVGYENGAVSIFTSADVQLEGETIQSGGPPIESVALAWPYVMVLSSSKSITLLQNTSDSKGASMKCLATLHSGSPLSMAALSLRKTSTTLVAGVLYAFNRFNAGWCLGLQEIRLDLEGTITSNRTTSSISTPLKDSTHAAQPPSFVSRSASTAPFSLHPQLMRAPNSLSYCGCYILAGLPDNTLMVYTVTSTEEKLEIGIGRRLWGHTSAISSAEVTSTGKAVSISSNSEETRYWELEEVLASSSSKRTSTSIESTNLSLLNDAIHRRGDGIGLAMKDVREEEQLFRRCVSFDDEQAIVIGERGQWQIISCYDFA